MSEMVERVARAMCTAADDDWDWSVFYIVDSNDTVETGREVYRDMARAAIEAMRIVTEDDVWLLGSAAENLRGGSRDEKTRVESAFRIASKLDDLRRRIDAALKD